MHLGVNLHKAFVAAQASDNQESIDTFVYEFCKLFDSHGTLEYAVGCVKFPDFLRYPKSVSAMKMNFTTGRVLMSLFHAKLAADFLSCHMQQKLFFWFHLH